MRLFEAILEANNRAVSGDKDASLHPQEFADALPVIALTCIDPRLNPLMPEVLGVPEEQFIWLRNAGNIITSPTSSTMRSLALACAVKKGKEIAIIGHTDCKVGRTSAMDLTDAFKALGVERSRLPENLVEFFGMFASERQNVIKGVDFVRKSPLIGAKVPVHGLLVDIQSGKLEWIVNGYQTLGRAVSEMVVKGPKVTFEQEGFGSMPAFQMAEMKFPESKIGDAASKVSPGISPPTAPSPTTSLQAKPIEMARVQEQPKPQAPARVKIDKTSMYKVLGEDKKVYGPATAAEIERWIEEGRIDLKTLVQKLGYKEWKQLETFIDKELPPEIPIPPALNTALKVIKTIKDYKDKTRR